MPVNVQTSTVATLVADEKRLAFFPSHFGTSQLMIRAESAIYVWMRRLVTTYQSGYWEFYSLSNGGMYVALRGEAPVTLRVQGNGFAGDMSVDAAGVVVTLFALCELMEKLDGDDRQDGVIRLYHWLRDYALVHAEKHLILAAID